MRATACGLQLEAGAGGWGAVLVAELSEKVEQPPRPATPAPYGLRPVSPSCAALQAAVACYGRGWPGNGLAGMGWGLAEKCGMDVSLCGGFWGGR